MFPMVCYGFLTLGHRLELYEISKSSSTNRALAAEGREQLLWEDRELAVVEVNHLRSGRFLGGFFTGKLVGNAW